MAYVPPNTTQATVTRSRRSPLAGIHNSSSATFGTPRFWQAAAAAARTSGNQRYGGRMASDLLMKSMNVFHKTLLKVSFGRLGWTAGSMPVVALTTTGRKSGEPRTVMLTSPVRHDGNLVLVASKGGDEHNPAWFLNLRDKPEVQVAMQGKPAQTMHARILTSDERTVLWPQIVAKYKNYGGYQTKTSREIPLVVLEPAR
jgi:deazaflavin-dependent oxidoreductase (nitroreductase family)